MWSDSRLLDLLGIELPIVQAPMAGAAFGELTSAVSGAGGLGSLGCAMLGEERLRSEVAGIRSRTTKPLNLNFFCHAAAASDLQIEEAWRRRLAPYYVEVGLDPENANSLAARAPFDEHACALIEEFRPEVVSFHFGLPAEPLLARVKAAGAKVLSSATTVAEARWLAARGCDAIIAQGLEAGGHRGMFLSADLATQTGTMALVPQVVDAVDLPVIAAGGIGDARGVAAAFALGAAGVQLGTAYLFCPEARITAVHRAALGRDGDHDTALTNVFTGRPARGIVNRFMREMGPIAQDAPAFPSAASTISPLREPAEAIGSSDFSPLWAGEAVRLGRELPAAELTRWLAAEALDRMSL